MKLTINWLIANATETSFERGEEYQDAVSKLQKHQSTLDTFFNQITTDWIYRLEDKTYIPNDYQTSMASK